MVELWFYSGRIGNCMFAYAFNKCIAEKLKLKCQFPKGTEITKFPLIEQETKDVVHHDDKYISNCDYIENPRVIVSDNDNMAWFLEKQFRQSKVNSYNDIITIDKILGTPDVEKKWIVTVGNFEIGYQYLPYREKLKQWFSFPEIDTTKFEFFRIHPELGNTNFYIHSACPEITKDDLMISLRLEDYTISQHLDRLLDYDYFKIILESKKWNNVFILTNPGSIGHNNQYEYIKEFLPYDPILVRCYEPVMSMAFGSQFNNIAISQSTYSWWLAFLSNADNIYYPIPITGPFALDDPKYRGNDLRVPTPEFKYVDYKSRTILPYDQYIKMDVINKKWID